MTDLTGHLEGWNHDSELPKLVGDALLASDCGWFQAVIETGFVLASLLLGEQDNVELRVGIAETIAAKLIETAKTGRLPGEFLQ
jgi:hypothetical protein